MFPLGPTKDGPGIIQNCFGMLDSDDCRLPRELQLAFVHLFAQNGDFSITKFRILASQFYLRRDDKSGWLSKWIIPRTTQRPVPFVVIPKPDEWSSNEVLEQDETRVSFRRLQKRMGRNVVNIMEKADKLRFLAWHQCYHEIDRRVKAGGRNVNKQNIYEEEIRKSLPFHTPSGRFERLVGLIRFIVEEQKEKFIIVSDRLFLLTFALHVSFPEEAVLTTGLSTHEVEGWNSGGGETLGHTFDRPTASSSRRRC